MMPIAQYSIVSRKIKSHAGMYERFHHSLKHFKLKFETTVDPTTLLEENNITPYWLDFKKMIVVFAEVTDTTQLSHSPFISDAIYETAEKLYFIPFSIFFNLAKRIKTLRTEIVLGTYTSRSGSTLICKIISHTQSVFVMSEPMCLNLVDRKCSLDKPFAKRMIRSLILFLSHFSAQCGKTHLYLKPFPLSEPGIIDKLFNIQTKKIFTWRDPYSTMASILKKQRFYERWVFYYFRSLVLKGIKMYWYNTYYDLLDKLDLRKLSSFEVIFYITWFSPILESLTNVDRSTENQQLIFNFDDLSSRSGPTFIKVLLRFLNLDCEYSIKMKEELNHDSQANTAMGQQRCYALTAKESVYIKEMIQAFSSKYNLQYP